MRDVRAEDSVFGVRRLLSRLGAGTHLVVISVLGIVGEKRIHRSTGDI